MNQIITCASTNDSAGLELSLGSGHDTLKLDTPLGVLVDILEPSLNLGAGNDTLKIDSLQTGLSVFSIGGDGLDTVDFGGRTNPVTATLNADFSQIAGEAIRPFGYEQLFGSQGNDS